ncbi:hypothetical protein BX666DRAFT_1971934 [Dichotomocladium elegans]|nr:hypothetical protein BX666DRAFT_1971934 [Dichotomocladium elegans]
MGHRSRYKMFPIFSLCVDTDEEMDFSLMDPSLMAFQHYLEETARDAGLLFHHSSPDGQSGSSEFLFSNIDFMGNPEEDLQAAAGEKDNNAFGISIPALLLPGPDELRYQDVHIPPLQEKPSSSEHTIHVGFRKENKLYRCTNCDKPYKYLRTFQRHRRDAIRKNSCVGHSRAGEVIFALPTRRIRPRSLNFYQ